MAAWRGSLVALTRLETSDAVSMPDPAPSAVKMLLLTEVIDRPFKRENGPSAKTFRNDFHGGEAGNQRYPHPRRIRKCREWPIAAINLRHPGLDPG
ncbi:hypothetical protein Sj15T_23120 [Sphingobium sp. TA15]|nr:hypothetical protein Sj15T_23120 [Sphingobium sp. TA15]